MLRFFKYSALIAIVVVATVATTMSFVKMSQARNVESQNIATQAVIVNPIFLEFQPFTVTLYGENRNRILYTSITLRLKNQYSQEQINQFMPEARDRILKTLSTLDENSVQTAQDRENLSQLIQTNLSRPYSEHLDKPEIMDVLFTAFVVQ